MQYELRKDRRTIHIASSLIPKKSCEIQTLYMPGWFVYWLWNVPRPWQDWMRGKSEHIRENDFVVLWPDSLYIKSWHDTRRRVVSFLCYRRCDWREYEVLDLTHNERELIRCGRRPTDSTSYPNMVEHLSPFGSPLVRLVHFPISVVRQFGMESFSSVRDSIMNEILHLSCKSDLSTWRIQLIHQRMPGMPEPPQWTKGVNGRKGKKLPNQRGIWSIRPT